MKLLRKLALVVLWGILLCSSVYSQNDKFGIYSNKYLNPNLSFDENVALYIWENTGKLGELKDNESMNEEYMRFAFSNKPKNWFGFGYAVIPDGNTVDMKKYGNGFLYFSIKVVDYLPDTLWVGIKSGSTTAGESWIADLRKYGFIDDKKWHSIKIPIKDFIDVNRNYFNIAQISQYFMLVGKKILRNGTIDYDEVYWSQY